MWTQPQSNCSVIFYSWLFIWTALGIDWRLRSSVFLPVSYFGPPRPSSVDLPSVAPLSVIQFVISVNECGQRDCSLNPPRNNFCLLNTILCEYLLSGWRLGVLFFFSALTATAPSLPLTLRPPPSLPDRKQCTFILFLLVNSSHALSLSLWTAISHVFPFSSRTVSLRVLSFSG